MKNDKWTTNVKLQQYRRLVELNAREPTQNILRQSKYFSRNLKTLSNDINEYRIVIFNNNNNDDDDDEKHVLQEHKDLSSTLINLSPSEILVHIFNDNCLKQKQLDKLCFQNKQKRNQVVELKMESIILSNKINQEKKQINPSDKILTRCQRSMARHNAAQSIQSTYESILKILEKDAIYYDNILRALINNQKEQSKMILQIILMGQIAVENLDTNHQKFNDLAQKVWINILERERTLKIARDQVEDVFTFAQTLIQLKSDTDFAEKSNKSHENNKPLEAQMQTLKQLFFQVKKSLNEQSMNVLHYRLEEQFTKKTNLSHHLKHVKNENDSLSKKKQHAQLILDAFQHTMNSAVEQYKLKRLVMIKEIKIKKKHQKDCKSTTKVQQGLLMKMMGALRCILDMFIIIDEKISKKCLEKKLVVEKMDETFTLLNQVIQCVTLLFDLSNNLQKDVNGAKDFYETYISDYKSKLKYKQQQQQQQDVESSDIFEEYEIIDANISTRKDIKDKSKHIVETRLANE